MKLLHSGQTNDASCSNFTAHVTNVRTIYNSFFSRNIEIMNVGYTGLTNRAEQLNRTGINQTKIP